MALFLALYDYLEYLPFYASLSMHHNNVRVVSAPSRGTSSHACATVHLADGVELPNQLSTISIESCREIGILSM